MVAPQQPGIRMCWSCCGVMVQQPSPGSGAGTAAGLSHASKASESGVVTGCSGVHLTWGRGSIRSKACRAWSCLAAVSCDPAVFGPPRAGCLPLRRRCIWWAGSAKTAASHGTAAATMCACPALHRSNASAEHDCWLNLGGCPAAAGAHGCKGLLAQVAQVGCGQSLIKMHTQLLQMDSPASSSALSGPLRRDASSAQGCWEWAHSCICRLTQCDHRQQHIKDTRVTVNRSAAALFRPR